MLAGSPAQADQARNDEWWLSTLHVTNAWQITRGSGVTIAVLDTGVDPAQPDLTGSITTGPDYTNSGRTEGGPFWGIHGTEIASLIAGHGHGTRQADGIIGIAPSAKILSVRVTLESNDPLLTNEAIAGALPDAIARGIRWAVRHEATVIVLPLDPVTTAGAAGSGGSAAERAAVADALAKHVVLVAPAGDGGAGTNAVNYPAAYHGVIAVGAFDQHFVKAQFSSRQPYVTVTAAGAGVTAANPSSLSATDPSKTYTQLNSTSAASAIVAGMAALIRAQFPDLTPAQVTRALTTSTVYRAGGRGDGSGSGTVDATKALTAAARITATVSKTPASGAAQSPPSAPPVHSSPIHRDISKQLIVDAVISGVVFLLLLGSIFGVRAWRRRHARSARLAEVRAATQVPARKPGTAKKGTAKKGTAKKGTAKKGTAKKGARKGAPIGPQVPAVVGGQAADAGAAPEPQPAGFVPAPLSPAVPGSGSPTFAGSASTGFTGSSSFTRSSGFAGSSSPGFTGSSGFTGSALSGFAGPGSSGAAGAASSGLAAAPTPPGFPAAPTPPGFAAAPTPPAPGAPAGSGSPGVPGSSSASPADAAPPARLAVPVDPASSASPESLAAAGADTPPWAPIPSDLRAPAQDAASAAIPDSAFPAPAVSAADAAGTGTDAAPGAVGQNRLGARRPSTAAHRAALPRNTQVSGRPPWDPAPEPASELPWAQAPAPPRGGAGSLPKRQQTRPAQPSWDALAEDVWPGGPRGAALHPPAPPPASRIPGVLASGGSAAGVPALGASPTGRPVPAAGLVPPRPNSAARARPAEERPGHKRNPATGAAPFHAAQPEPAPAAGAPGRPGAGTGIFPASKPGGAAASTPASAPGGGAASTPADAAASTPDDATASEPPAPLPRRLSTPPLHPPSPSQPGQSGTDSSLFRHPGQPPFPPAPRPAAEPGAAGTWLPNTAGPFPPAPKPIPKPTTGASASDAAAAGAGLPGAGKAPLGGPAVTGGRSGTVAPADPAGPGSTFPQPAGPGSTFPQAAQPSADSSQPADSIPPWEITDSGRTGAGTAEPSDSTESFAAVDPGAEQRSLPPVHPGDGDERLPASRRRADADAFRLFPPVRGTANRPPAPPPSDGQD